MHYFLTFVNKKIIFPHGMGGLTVNILPGGTKGFAVDLYIFYQPLVSFHMAVIDTLVKMFALIAKGMEIRVQPGHIPDFLFIVFFLFDILLFQFPMFSVLHQ